MGFEPIAIVGRACVLPGADSPECYPNIAAGLTARGWSDEDVAKVMGENALRVLAAVLK